MKLTLAVLMLALAGCSKPQHKLTAAEQAKFEACLERYRHESLVQRGGWRQIYSICEQESKLEVAIERNRQNPPTIIDIEIPNPFSSWQPTHKLDCTKKEDQDVCAWLGKQLVLPDILEPMPEVSYIKTFAFDIGVPPADDHVEIVGKNVRCSACHTKDVSDAVWLMKLKLQRGIERAKAVKRGEKPQW